MQKSILNIHFLVKERCINQHSSYHIVPCAFNIKNLCLLPPHSEPSFPRTSISLTFFGHGTLFNLVNVYGTRMFCGSLFIKKKVSPMSPVVTKWKVRTQLRIWTVPWTATKRAKYNLFLGVGGSVLDIVYGTPIDISRNTSVLQKIVS